MVDLVRGKLPLAHFIVPHNKLNEPPTITHQYSYMCTILAHRNQQCHSCSILG